MSNPIPPSSKQKKLIKALESKTGEKFTGKTMSEAIEYIDKHKSLIDKIDYREGRPPSKKQKDAIEKICRMYDIEFTGSTMVEACNFLDEWLPKYMSYWEEKRKEGKK